MSLTVFEYTGVTTAGLKRRGMTTASSRGEALQALSRMGITPTALRARRGGGAPRSRAKPRDVADFTSQLAVLLSARIPLSEGLRSIAAQDAGGAMTPLIEDVCRRVEAGERLADAMGAHERVLGRAYVRTVRAAEESGNLVGMLEYLAQMLEKHAETRQQVRGALMYPACVTCVLTIAVLFMVVFVVPKFGSLFAARGVDLPGFTRALMGLSGSMHAYWYAYAGAGAGLVLGLRRYAATPGGRLAIDRAMHRVPYLNKILRSLAIGRFARVLGVCLGSGVSLIDAIRLAGDASGRPMMRADAERMAEHVRVGGRVGEVLDRCEYLTPFARRMLSAGEESGELPRMCDVVARQQEREASHLTKNLGTVLEPLLVVAIAGVVMVIALAIFLPMWNMATLMGAK